MSTKVKIAIIGGREFKNLYKVECLIKQLIKYYGDDGFLVISGGARGVDTYAENTALSYGIEAMIFPANWEKYGLSAGHIRNGKMAEKADYVYAFWDGKTERSGTLGMIQISISMDKLADIILDTND